MTTNHIERLDSALIRPGRVDVQEFIGNASPEQARRLFMQFYGSHADVTGSITPEEQGDKHHLVPADSETRAEQTQGEKEAAAAAVRLQSFAKALEDRLETEAQNGREPSMASLQGHFIRYPADEAITHLDELFAPPATDEVAPAPAIVIALCGNKTDLEARRQVTQEEAQKYAEEEGLLWFETSAKSGTGVSNVFTTIGMMMALIPAHTASTHLSPDYSYETAEEHDASHTTRSSRQQPTARRRPQ